MSTTVTRTNSGRTVPLLPPQELVCLVGATGTGKTHFARKFVEEKNTELEIIASEVLSAERGASGNNGTQNQLGATDRVASSPAPLGASGRRGGSSKSLVNQPQHDVGMNIASHAGEQHDVSQGSISRHPDHFPFYYLGGEEIDGFTMHRKHKRVLKLLAEGHSVMFDDSNEHVKGRTSLLESVATHHQNVRRRVIYMESTAAAAQWMHGWSICDGLLSRLGDDGTLVPAGRHSEQDNGNESLLPTSQQGGDGGDGARGASVGGGSGKKHRAVHKVDEPTVVEPLDVLERKSCTLYELSQNPSNGSPSGAADGLHQKRTRCLFIPIDCVLDTSATASSRSDYPVVKPVVTNLISRWAAMVAGEALGGHGSGRAAKGEKGGLPPLGAGKKGPSALKTSAGVSQDPLKLLDACCICLVGSPSATCSSPSTVASIYDALAKSLHAPRLPSQHCPIFVYASGLEAGTSSTSSRASPTTGGAPSLSRAPAVIVKQESGGDFTPHAPPPLGHTGSSSPRARHQATSNNLASTFPTLPCSTITPLNVSSLAFLQRFLQLDLARSCYMIPPVSNATSGSAGGGRMASYDDAVIASIAELCGAVGLPFVQGCKVLSFDSTVLGGIGTEAQVHSAKIFPATSPSTATARTSPPLSSCGQSPMAKIAIPFRPTASHHHTSVSGQRVLPHWEGSVGHRMRGVIVRLNPVAQVANGTMSSAASKEQKGLKTQHKHAATKPKGRRLTMGGGGLEDDDDRDPEQVLFADESSPINALGDTQEPHHHPGARVAADVEGPEDTSEMPPEAEDNSAGGVESLLNRGTFPLLRGHSPIAITRSSILKLFSAENIKTGEDYLAHKMIGDEATFAVNHGSSLVLVDAKVWKSDRSSSHIVNMLLFCDQVVVARCTCGRGGGLCRHLAAVALKVSEMPVSRMPKAITKYPAVANEMQIASGAGYRPGAAGTAGKDRNGSADSSLFDEVPTSNAAKIQQDLERRKQQEERAAAVIASAQNDALLPTGRSQQPTGMSNATPTSTLTTQQTSTGDPTYKPVAAVLTPDGLPLHMVGGATRTTQRRIAPASTATEGGGKQTAEDKQRYKVVGPNAPSKPYASSYFYFCELNRAEAIKALSAGATDKESAGSPSGGGGKVTEVAKELGRMWRGLDPAEKDAIVKAMDAENSVRRGQWDEYERTAEFREAKRQKDKATAEQSSTGKAQGNKSPAGAKRKRGGATETTSKKTKKSAGESPVADGGDANDNDKLDVDGGDGNSLLMGTEDAMIVAKNSDWALNDQGKWECEWDKMIEEEEQQEADKKKQHIPGDPISATAAPIGSSHLGGGGGGRKPSAKKAYPKPKLASLYPDDSASGLSTDRLGGGASTKKAGSSAANMATQTSRTSTTRTGGTKSNKGGTKGNLDDDSWILDA